MGFVRKNIALIVLFLLFEVFIIVALDSIYKEKSELILEKRMEVFKAYFNSSLSNYENTTEIMFREVINRDGILSSFKDAYTASEEQRKVIRQDLYRQLVESYKRLQAMKLRQFHFHLPDNSSFLRFHKPEKYGDDLTNIRESVRLVNLRKKKITGFEEGRLLNSFRYVYPLFWEKRHIGSVETSLSFHIVKSDIEKHKGSFVNFMMKKSIIDRKVWPEAKSNYEDSDLHEGYMYERKFDKTQFFHGFDARDIRAINRDIYEKVRHRIDNIEEFVVSSTIGNDSYIVSFIPIPNVAGEDGASYLISYEKSDILQNFESDHLTISIIVSLLNFLIFFFIYIIVKQNFELKLKAIELAEEELKLREMNDQVEMTNVELTTLFNIQRDMIILTDGETIQKYNNKFLEFFGLSSIEEFNDSEKHIYDYFIHRSGFMHGSSGKEWIHQMIEADEKSKEAKVILYSKKAKEERFFSIHYSRYPLLSGYYLISFSDITESEKYLQLIESVNQQQKELLVIDGLTEIYNRRFFDETFQREIDRAKRDRHQLTFFILDIDYFKQYNDTYGHQAGDVALKRVAKQLQEKLKRASDFAFRLGGEEFGAIFSNVDLDDSMHLADEIRASIESLHIEHKTSKVSKVITVSVGLAFIDIDENINGAKLYGTADKALYLAKREGRNRVKIIH
jgi:diguanylate cyclase (GGDEF)-like protein